MKIIMSKDNILIIGHIVNLLVLSMQITPFKIFRFRLSISEDERNRRFTATQ